MPASVCAAAAQSSCRSCSAASASRTAATCSSKDTSRGATRASMLHMYRNLVNLHADGKDVCSGACMDLVPCSGCGRQVHAQQLLRHTRGRGL